MWFEDYEAFILLHHVGMNLFLGDVKVYLLRDTEVNDVEIPLPVAPITNMNQ